MTDSAHRHVPVLEFLKRQLDGSLTADTVTHMRYPTAISALLRFRIVEIGEALAVIELDANCAIHGNQQGTVHGGLLCELADAAIGTAHSTVMDIEESFTSIDLRATFCAPCGSRGFRRAHGPSIAAGLSVITDATFSAKTAKSWRASRAR